ncbi:MULTISPECIES: BPSS1780 family membrane protein [unclassified Variovorax]|uniref:BPSS1780 family membrane protein n=1 Tax=unclassified Variovorax TaxID=663243 RepID=UPI002578E127|nr:MULTISPECIES: BPSS1780 family membrane protein [unclassified Variovorax]MDM0087817.1 BPSS1780 family membrane protein [Variovorax sp. J22G40]MDM0143926.1 BPSS1780 family membrane protein [Variovorax sp. J2P1-31]
MKLNIVPARTGATWVRSGLQTFTKRPLAFASLFFFFMAMVSIASQLPLVGTALALMLLPTMTLGLMAASAEAAKAGPGQKPPAAAVLLAALTAARSGIRPMLVLGALYAVLFLLVMGVSALADGGQFARVYLMGETVSREMAESGSFQAALWIAMALYLPLSLAFWHAPALVHWHGVPPTKSLFFSFIACFRNFGAMFVFGLTWIGVFIGSGIVLSLVATLFAALVGGGAAAAGGALMVGGALVMASMFFTSTWFTFRDSFID